MFQVVEDGYEFFAKRQLVTLFSAPNYCGEFDNAGAMMSVDETLMCSFQVRYFCNPRWFIMNDMFQVKTTGVQPTIIVVGLIPTASLIRQLTRVWNMAIEIGTQTKVIFTWVHTNTHKNTARNIKQCGAQNC